MTLTEILLEQNYLHSLIQHGIDVEENTKKMDMNYANPLLIDSRIDCDIGVLESFRNAFSTRDKYKFKFGNNVLEISLHEDNTEPTNIGKISTAVDNIIGEVYITDTHVYLVYRRENNSDMSRSLVVSRVIAKVVPDQMRF